MTLRPGSRVGVYEVVALIGAGGMGEVYRARDTTLGRDVALKILPERVAADADRLARFAREAQTLAALNHPGIAHIYGLERRAAGDAVPSLIVMELVDGEDLATRIARGPIPLEESIAIAARIADALEAAHDHGIIHRDLKPANIKVRPDGTAKILDFGLAKTSEHSSEPHAADAASMSPTITSPAVTAAGVILGTAAYMAPEQAKGRVVDRRADIWAFGVVLFEMLTGRPLFGGESVAETIGLVVTREPDWAALPADTPQRVSALLKRCLTKDPRNRLRDIGEARILLAQGDDAPAPGVDRWSTRGRIIAAAAAGAAAIGVGLLAGSTWRRPPAAAPAPLRRFELPAGLVAATVGPVISNDGSRIAFVARSRLRVQALDALDSEDLGPVPVNTSNVFWSPDSRTIGFDGEATVHTIPAAGGPVFVVCKVPASGNALHLLWRRDGTILMAVWRDSLYRVPSTGGTPEIFLRADPATEVDFHTTSELPGNRLIIATHVRDGDRDRYEIYDGKQRRLLTDAAGAERFVYADPGYLLFVRIDPNRGIWAVPFADGPLDLSRATLVEPGAIRASVADDGTIVATIPPSAPALAEFVWFDRSGAATPIPGDPVEIGSQQFALSPDGRRIVFVAGSKPSVFVRNVASGLDARLTFEEHEYGAPSWFPGGDRVLYLTDVAMTRPTGRDAAVTTAFLGKIVVQRTDGADRPTPIADGSALPRVAPDGKSLVFIVDDGGRGRLKVAPLAADGSVGTPRPFFSGSDEPNVRWFDVSRDGRVLAYTAQGASQRLDIFASDFPEGTGRWEVREGGNFPRFSPVSDELFFLSGTRPAPIAGFTNGRSEPTGHFNVVPIVSRPTVTVGRETVLFDTAGPNSPGSVSLGGFSVAPDGRRFLAARRLTPTAQVGRRLVLVQNWSAVLRRK